MVRYPETADTTVATATAVQLVLTDCKAFGSSSNPLAAIAGIESRKENRAAVSRVRPENKPPVIVVPEREEPGMSAST